MIKQLLFVIGVLLVALNQVSCKPKYNYQPDLSFLLDDESENIEPIEIVPAKSKDIFNEFASHLDNNRHSGNRQNRHKSRPQISKDDEDIELMNDLYSEKVIDKLIDDYFNEKINNIKIQGRIMNFKLNKNKFESHFSLNSLKK